MDHRSHRHSQASATTASSAVVSAPDDTMPAENGNSTSSIVSAVSLSEEYFNTTNPPACVQENAAKTHAFVLFHLRQRRRIVLITSGGTTVPLENQTVRFIDNFSAGTRGATSAEYFIDAGYAVIFMHRTFSLQPYTRHYSHSKNCFLDFLQANDQGGIAVVPEYLSQIKNVLLKYQEVRKNNLLLMIDFVTVTDYLFLLRRITQIVALARESAMYYLAAAVSDFYIPASKMVEHKIQSGDGALSLQLDQVPKIIKPLVKEWATKGLIVSFKLETDPTILEDKARRALIRYGHQIVIGNILSTRKSQVHLITQNDAMEITLSPEEVKQDVEIEAKIIPELVQRHTEWIRNIGDWGVGN
ncbi:phosphopantothenate---cysteine ligase (CTP) [Synchytrium endobioticum]|uniref:Phosphopantothenate---cysteine ligase (CTP) n=1 Tax=Synchytrium endobioticum TaxID=286115 RepID=A0A507CQ13_9FUNG|nr:phosphopantothenate---cysteine ligase (CTP) [Synchytrium endobioticum]